MKYEPHEYQRYAINYIEDHPFAAVLLDMGLGKTSIRLEKFYDLISRNATVTLTNRQLDTTFFEGSMRDIPDRFSNCIVEDFCVSNTGDFLFKIKVNPVPANEEKRLWHEGSLRVHGSIFHYWFKQYDEGSEFGIDGGRISKLMLKRNGEIVCNYDRGWDVQPVDEDTQFAYEILVHTENF